MSPGQERVGIVLVRGCFPNEVKGRQFCWPDEPGMLNVRAASYALRTGLVDRLVVLGSRPDQMGRAMEIGYLQALRAYVGEERQLRVEVLPRGEEFEGLETDLRSTRTSLAERHPGQRFSNNN